MVKSGNTIHITDREIIFLGYLLDKLLGDEASFFLFIP
jgi:hypothetical protein